MDYIDERRGDRVNGTTIAINYESEQPTVLGRDLHEALGINTPYRSWFPRMCEYGFSEGIDYTPYKFVHPQNKQEITDHQLTIPMAKEICMLQRTDKGKEFRQYFIKVEEQWNTPEAVMARALQYAQKRLDAVIHSNHLLEEQIAKDKPKVVFADAVSTLKTSILIGDLAKLIKQNGVDIGQKRLFEYMRVNGYLIKSGDSKNMPKQRYMEQGLFEVKESTSLNPDGSSRVNRTTKVTGKGQRYFINLFLNKEKESDENNQGLIMF